MLKVLKPGFYTSIQDAGRFGYRRYGVPVSGAMDSYSSQFANVLLGNAENAAVIEITMIGPTLQFLQPTIISISGGDLQPKLNEGLIKMNTAISVKANDILSFGILTTGFRTYLAVKEGFLTPLVLGSRSMFTPITTKNRLKKNDTIAYNSFEDDRQKLNAIIKYNNEIIESNLLDVFKGPEFNKLSIKVQKQLFKTNFSVSKLNNRMAYQLEPVIKNNTEQTLTSPVLPGTIQLTPSGNLIALMSDCQSTGGYPRVLQLSEKAVNILSQKATGNTIKFRLKV